MREKAHAKKGNHINYKIPEANKNLTIKMLSEKGKKTQKTQNR